MTDTRNDTRNDLRHLPPASQAYFSGWRDRQPERVRTALADDVTFAGPVGVANGVEECLAGLTQLAAITKDLVINRAVVDGDDVLTWFTLSTTVVDEPFPVVNWSHLRNGRIDRIRAVFDPRALLAAG